MTDVTIYHNPSCGTSRNVLGLIRDAGIEPRVIEYLKTPPDRPTLESLLVTTGLTPRQLLRTQERRYAELGLADENLSASQLIDAILAQPVLLQRPIVVTPHGVRLCRPAETVLQILP